MACTLLSKGRIPVLSTRCPRKSMPKTLLATLMRMPLSLKHSRMCLTCSMCPFDWDWVIYIPVAEVEAMQHFVQNHADIAGEPLQKELT